MAQAIGKAVVIGAGSMGAGIATLFANKGIPVTLLDIPGPGDDRAAVACAGKERQIKAQGFTDDAAIARMTVGCVDDDLETIADADWVVEAVIENLAIKQALFRRIETVRRPGTAMSSNTSTILRARLMDGMAESLRRDFVITHFFNPPGQMRLLELVTGTDNDPATVAMIRDGADRILGKTIVTCRDTPGFIANRIGCCWMSIGVLEALRRGLTVEEADAVAGPPFGVPRTGVFGLLDLVGIDLVPSVWGSLMASLPERDAHHRYDLTTEPLIRRLIAEGRIGRKAKAGFYRKAPDRGTREALDLTTENYRPQREATPAGDLTALIAQSDPAGRYAWAVLSETVTYVAQVAAEIADDEAAIDTAMQLGYGWAEGPLALADRIGCGFLVERLRAENRLIPPRLEEAARAGGFFTGP